MHIHVVLVKCRAKKKKSNLTQLFCLFFIVIWREGIHAANLNYIGTWFPFNRVKSSISHSHFFWWMQICYFFYKNITFGFTLFWFEAYATFSGQPAYNDWYMSFYNVFFTSLPVIALGVFDQDVSAQLCLEVGNSCPVTFHLWMHINGK